MTLNPFKYFAEERAKDRELQMALVERLFASANRQSDVAVEQAKAMNTFMSLYLNFNGPPQYRLNDDQSEFDAEERRLTLRDMD